MQGAGEVKMVRARNFIDLPRGCHESFLFGKYISYSVLSLLVT